MQPTDTAVKSLTNCVCVQFVLLLPTVDEHRCTQVVGNYNGSTKEYEEVKGTQIFWGGGRTSPPPDVPECGFDGSGCPEDRKSKTFHFLRQ